MGVVQKTIFGTCLLVPPDTIVESFLVRHGGGFSWGERVLEGKVEPCSPGFAIGVVVKLSHVNFAEGSRIFRTVLNFWGIGKFEQARRGVSAIVDMKSHYQTHTELPVWRALQDLQRAILEAYESGDVSRAFVLAHFARRYKYKGYRGCRFVLE